MQFCILFEEKKRVEEKNVKRLRFWNLEQVKIIM